MRSLTQLANFVRVKPRPPALPEEDGRVVALFKNRAELKKAYSELQEEVFRLKDRIKQQEGATARVQEMLGALESRLGLVETAYPALVFYQLRALWQLGREIIEQFVTELTSQQEERERRAHLAESNRRQFARRQATQSRLRAAETAHADAQALHAELTATRAKLTRLWHYFKRRDVDKRLQAAQAAVGECAYALNEARTAAETFEQEAAPEFSGLSLEARRAINLAAVAYAEVLCVRLSGTSLVALAKEATGRREPTEAYGERDGCEALIAQIAEARAMLTGRVNVAADVRARTERLRLVSRYRNAGDTAPTPESIALSEGDVLGANPVQAHAAPLPNVLAEDTWDLFRVLLR